MSLNPISSFFRLFSSAGGGGSFSGGGGGGGGGSSFSGGSSGDGSSSNPFTSIAMVAMFPTTAVSAVVVAILTTIGVKFDKEGLVKSSKLIACIVGSIAAVIVSVVMMFAYVDVIVDDRIDYNSSIVTKPYKQEKETGPFVHDYIVGFVVSAIGGAFGICMGVGIGESICMAAVRRYQQIKRNKQLLAKAAAADPAWSKSHLVSSCRDTFYAYQYDWSNLNIEGAKAYTTDRYYGHVELMLTAFRESRRRNVTTVRSVNDMTVVDVKNPEGELGDEFTVNIRADITDELFDDGHNSRLMSRKKFELIEDWVFKRDGDQWRLDGINPATTELATRCKEIYEFALKNNAYYSLDWGRMLLPKRGQIFNRHVYKKADVNNHVIGRMSSTGRIMADDVVYQLYTYSKEPYFSSDVVYMVGQIFVPKDYGNILIRRNLKSHKAKWTTGLTKVELESGEFNRKYHAYASAPEQVITFELLHPAMMQTLLDAKYNISIEVIGNSIYFYAPMRRTSVATYEEMLRVLQAAYRELKM